MNPQVPLLPLPSSVLEASLVGAVLGGPRIAGAESRLLVQEFFEPAVAPPLPARFSVRAALAGDAEGAAHLQVLEQACIRAAEHAAPSPFVTAVWQSVLEAFNYPKHALDALISALVFGVSIDPAPDAQLGLPLRLPNHASAFAQASTVHRKVAEQLAAKTLVAWPANVEAHIVSPLGTVSKFESVVDERAFEAWRRSNASAFTAAAASDAAARDARQPIELASLALPSPPAPLKGVKVRVIHDARERVNDRGAAPKLGRLDTLREIVKYLRPGDFLWTEDLRGAYKQVRIVPWMLLLTTTSFLGVLVADSRLTFGLNTSPHRYTACLGHPLLWAAIALTRRRGVPGWIFQYIDDHIGASPSRDAALLQQRCLWEAAAMLGAALEEDKRVNPTQRAKVLGLIVHTVPVVLVECPADKLERIRAILEDARGRGSITRRALESVVGQIGFVAVSIRGAAIFSAELLAILGATGDAPVISLSEAVQCDLAFWCDFAHQWNGSEVVLHRPTMDAGHASADAMLEGNVGAIGLFFCGRGFHIPVQVGSAAHETPAKIATLELVAFAMLSVLIAAALGGRGQPAEADVLIPCVGDNTNVYNWIRNGRSRDTVANHILRFAWRISTTSRTRCSLKWVPSADNALADACSRNDATRFAHARVLYLSDLSSRPGAFHGWPASFVARLQSHAAITACGPGSVLHALAARLGANHGSGLPDTAQQMVGILRDVQVFLNQP
jgi:hypothetical protein